MVETFLGYLSAFVFFSALIYLAQYTDGRRARAAFKTKLARNKTTPHFTGLNVSSVPVSLEEIQAREFTRLLNDVSMEIVNISRLIQSYVPHRDLPVDGFQRLLMRRERLRAQYERLIGGDPCVTEALRLPKEPTIIVRESMRRPIRALPQPKPVPARQILEIINVRPRRTNRFIQ